MPVHHIHMNSICASLFCIRDLLTKVSKISGENRGSEFEDMVLHFEFTNERSAECLRHAANGLGADRLTMK